MAPISRLSSAHRLPRHTGRTITRLKSGILLSPLVLAPVQPATTWAYPEPAPVPVMQWGSPGTGPGQFRGATTLAVDSHGNVWAADGRNHRVQVFDNSGNFLMAFGDSGCANGQMIQPLGIDIDLNDNVYVASWGGPPANGDSCVARIQKFSPSGQFLARWSELGNGPGEINGPFGLTVDGGGFVYVAEFNASNRVQKFAPDGTSVLTWNGTESSIPQLGNPVGIAVDPQTGHLIVTDWGPAGTGHRVLRFSNTGAFLYKYSQPYGSGDGQFSQPCGTTVDAGGNIYVVDRGNSRIQKFAPNGTLLVVWGSPGTGPGEFVDPWDIAVDASGNICVSDAVNRIQKFRVPTSSASPDNHRMRPVASPNPFSASTRALWSGASPGVRGNARVIVSDVAGRLVRTLAPTRDEHDLSVLWDGRDDAGREVGPGLYYLRLSGAPDLAAIRVVRRP